MISSGYLHNYPTSSNYCSKRVYDNRIRELICKKGNPYLFAQLKIPRSTAYGWIHRGARKVVTTDVFSMNEIALQQEVLELRQKVKLLTTLLRLVFTVTRILGVRLDSERLPEGKAKLKILHVVQGTIKGFVFEKDFEYFAPFIS